MYFAGNFKKKIKMESTESCTELQSTFESIDNYEFEEKVDIEDLVLASKPTAISNSETIDIKSKKYNGKIKKISI